MGFKCLTTFDKDKKREKSGTYGVLGLALGFFDSVSEYKEEVGQLALDFFDSVSEYVVKSRVTNTGFFYSVSEYVVVG